MKKEEFLTYQKFNDQAAAAELAELFQENGLGFLLEDDSLNFDASFAYNELNKEFRVKLKSEDFKLADKILREVSLKAIDYIEEDYYLFQFSNEELHEIVEKADEWSTFDVVLAEELLKKRGVEVQIKTIEKLRSERMEELAKPLTISTFWLFIAYLLAFLGGILGLFVGWYIAYQRKTLPNGESEFVYASKYRDHGIVIMILGGFFFLITIALKIYQAGIIHF